MSSGTPIEAQYSELEIMEMFDSPRILEDIEDFNIDENIDKDELSLFEKIHDKRCRLDPSASSFYNFGQFYQYDMQKHFSKAVHLYEKAIEYKDEDDFEGELYTDFGKLYWLSMEENHAIAKQYLKKGIKACPNSEYCLNAYVLLLENENDDEKALEKYYKKLIKLDPTNEDYIDNLGTLYMDLNRFTKAIKLYKKALKKNKSEENFFNYIHALHMSDADEATRRKVLEKALKRYPDSVDLNKQRGHFISEFESSNTIEKHLLEKLELNNEDLEALQSFLKLKMADSAYDEALVYCDKIFTLTPDDFYANLCKAIVMGVQREPLGQVRAQFEKVAQIRPNDGTVYYSYLQALLTGSAPDEEIIATAEKVLEFGSEEGIEHSAQQIIDLRKTDISDLSAYDTAIAQCDNDVDKLLSVLSGNTNLAECLAYLNAVEKIEPFNSILLLNKAIVLMSFGNILSGEKYLQDKINAAPDNKDTYVAMINYYVNTYQFDTGIIICNIAIGRFPEDQEFKTWLFNLENTYDDIEFGYKEQYSDQFPFFGAGNASYFEYLGLTIRFYKAPDAKMQKKILALLPDDYNAEIDDFSGQFLSLYMEYGYAGMEGIYEDDFDALNTNIELALIDINKIHPIEFAYRSEDTEAAGTEFSKWHKDSGNGFLEKIIGEIERGLDILEPKEINYLRDIFKEICNLYGTKKYKKTLNSKAWNPKK